MVTHETFTVLAVAGLWQSILKQSFLGYTALCILEQARGTALPIRQLVRPNWHGIVLFRAHLSVKAFVAEYRVVQLEPCIAVLAP